MDTAAEEDFDITVKSESNCQLDDNSSTAMVKEEPWVKRATNDDWNTLRTRDGVETKNDEQSKLYTSLPSYEYIIHQSDILKQSASEKNQQSHPDYAITLSTRRLTSLINVLDSLVKDIKCLIKSTCSINPTSEEDIKPPPLQSNESLLSAEEESVQINENMSLILGLTHDLNTSLMLFVNDPDRINTEYNRCASVVDALAQMITYRDAEYTGVLIECEPSLTNCVENDDPSFGYKYSKSSECYEDQSLSKPQRQKRLRKKKGNKKATTDSQSNQRTLSENLNDTPNEILEKYTCKKLIDPQIPKVNRKLGFYPEFGVNKSDYDEIVQKGGPYTCPRCQRTFIERRSLENHLFDRCVGKPFVWKEFEPKFKEENGNFYCMLNGCSAVVKVSNSKCAKTAPIYRHHQEVHLVGIECPYKCPIDNCGMSFFMRGLLGEHTRDVHEKKRFCDICGKGVSSFKLKVHMRRHAGDKPFKCTYCDYLAVEIGRVNRHIKEVHESHRLTLQFCDICGKSYKSKKTLQDHVKTHSDVPPFQCKECGKGFKHRSNYGRHMVNIHKIKHSCDLCGTDFFSTKGLQQHRQKVHNIIG